MSSIEKTHSLMTFHLRSKYHEFTRLCAVRCEWWVYNEKPDKEKPVIELKLGLDFHAATIFTKKPPERLQIVFASAICEAFEVGDRRIVEPERITKLTLGQIDEVNKYELSAEANFSADPVTFFTMLAPMLEKLSEHAEMLLAREAV